MAGGPPLTWERSPHATPTSPRSSSTKESRHFSSQAAARQERKQALSTCRVPGLPSPQTRGPTGRGPGGGGEHKYTVCALVKLQFVMTEQEQPNKKATKRSEEELKQKLTIQGEM